MSFLQIFVDAIQRQLKARENWIKCYLELGSVSQAAIKCGIPWSTLYRWIKRFNAHGKVGLIGFKKTTDTSLAKDKLASDNAYQIY